MRPKRPPLHPQWAEWQPYGGKPSVKVSRIFISPHYSFAPNGRHCTHSEPNGSYIGGELPQPTWSTDYLIFPRPFDPPDGAPNDHHCTHSGPNGSHGGGGKPSVKVSRIFISPHYSFAQCAPNGRHCTHSGPNGSHMGGNLVSKSREFYYSSLLIRPMRPKRPATAPTVGRMAAIWGET